MKTVFQKQIIVCKRASEDESFGNSRSRGSVLANVNIIHTLIVPNVTIPISSKLHWDFPRFCQRYE